MGVSVMNVRTPTIRDLGEHALIARITARLTSPGWVIVGPGDDAAVIEPERGQLEVLTTDAVVDGVHVDTRIMPADAIGHRAMAVNLSDLAAMGARPRAALLSLALPNDLEVATLDAIVGGILRVAAEQHVAVVGGNVTQAPGPLQIHVTATGTVGRRRILTRGGARPGDEVYVTGSLGGAAVGLRMLHASPAPGASSPTRVFSACERRYLYPNARVNAGLQLSANRVATSCVDLSDGIADGVRLIAAASGVGIILDADALPIDAEVRRWQLTQGVDLPDLALSGGDDYELLFTARPRSGGRLRAARRRLGDLPITRIGRVTRALDLRLVGTEGAHEIPPGYEHFR
jgi:thiamine-monophosphate kinase